jgi:hypothetical protein
VKGACPRAVGPLASGGDSRGCGAARCFAAAGLASGPTLECAPLLCRGVGRTMRFLKHSASSAERTLPLLAALIVSAPTAATACERCSVRRDGDG